MFQIASANQTYSTSVRVDVPTDGGKNKTHVFKAIFKRVSQSELDNIHERIQEKTLTDAGLINEVMVGWDDVADEHGQKVEFNPDNLSALLDMYPTRPTIVQTFFTTINNAVRKN